MSVPCRGGAALSPIVVGILFTMGLGLQGVAIIMALGAATAVVALLRLGKSTADMEEKAARGDGRV